MTSAYPKPSLPDEQLAIAWQCASLLIGYPDEQLLSQAPLLRDASHLLPERIGAPLRDFVVHLQSTPLTRLATDYVQTFDHQRRCCLFLTYFAYGDTRKRGMALLQFKQAYKQAGLVLSADELPDHLSVVLEFGATGDRQAAWQLLLQHRAGLEVLRIALRDSGSAWLPVVEVVTATLPALRGDEQGAVARLVAQGPPDEEVGLAPFAVPEFRPGARAASQTAGQS